LTQRDQARLVRQALDTLPPREREVFVLTYSYHYSAQAIAAYQDCTVATVRYRMRQARHRLAATLTAWGLAPQALSQPLRRV
jgi:RNA polymerase sigma-70 factor (ECF subfamily)